MTKNQRQFIRDAEKQGFEIDHDYSGRGMYGKTCPSIIEERYCNSFVTKASVRSDSMGLDTVIYCPN